MHTRLHVNVNLVSGHTNTTTHCMYTVQVLLSHMNNMFVPNGDIYQSCSSVYTIKTKLDTPFVRRHKECNQDVNCHTCNLRGL